MALLSQKGSIEFENKVKVKVFSPQSIKQQLNGNSGTVFSVCSMLRYYKQDN
jgi:hypothetical protein